MDERVRKYIITRQSQGVSLSVIRSELLARGYSNKDIQEFSVINLSSSFLLLLFLIGLVFFGVFVWYYSISAPIPRISVTLITSSPLSGGFLDFVTSVSGIKGAKALVVHELIDAKNVSVMRVEQQVVDTSSRFSLRLPDVQGHYVLISSVANTRSVQFVQIYPKTKLISFCTNGVQDQSETGIDCGGPCSPCVPQLGNCSSSCDDSDSCTSDSCVHGQCISIKISVCCGDFMCSSNESSFSCPSDCALISVQKSSSDTLFQARKISLTNLQLAINLCTTLPINSESDECFSIVALEGKNKDVCARVSSSLRDSCYLDYAQKTQDYSVCEIISNRLFKASCFSFRNSLLS